jgi:hypothetical protein
MGLVFVKGEGTVRAASGEQWPIPPTLYPVGPDGQMVKGISF